MVRKCMFHVNACNVVEKNVNEYENVDNVVDKEKLVNEADNDFHYNVDETIEFIGCRRKNEIVDGDESTYDIKVLDNDYFESALDEENEVDFLRNRKLKQIRKQAHATSLVYKTYFYVGQESEKNNEVKELVKDNSIEIRRELRMEKERQRNSGGCMQMYYSSFAHI
ncbi:hypothetical protein Tco_0185095 [Tanacetum coccineum]